MALGWSAELASATSLSEDATTLRGLRVLSGFVFAGDVIFVAVPLRTLTTAAPLDGRHRIFTVVPFRCHERYRPMILEEEERPVCGRSMMEDTPMVRGFRSLILTGVAALLLIAAGAAMYAQGPGQGGGPGRHGMRGGFPILRELDLTDAQTQQVRDVMQRHRDEMRQIGERLGQAFDAQRNAVDAVPVNEDLIRTTTQDLAAAQTEMAILRSRIHSEVFSLLTLEQQEKAKQVQAQHEARMNQRRERMRQWMDKEERR